MAAGTLASSLLPTQSGASGRPKHSINMEQVVVLRSLRFTWQEISHIVGVSVKTLQRRAKEYGVTRFSSITDNELDEVVRNCLEDFPRAGEVMLRGQLISLDLRVPRQRLRESLQRLGFRNSLPPAITRRTYSVPGPNALWHALCLVAVSQYMTLECLIILQTRKDSVLVFRRVFFDLRHPIGGTLYHPHL